MPNRINRRRFIQNSSAIGAGLWLSNQSNTLLSASPHERVNVASVGVGVGGKGSSDCDGAGKYGQIVAIGDVREVHVWTNRPYSDWKAGKMYWKQAPQITARPKATPPIPEHISWDLWLGPAPSRPYNPAYHPHDWRGWWEL